MDINERTREVQNQIEGKLSAVSRGKLARVLKMSRKPDMDEYKKTIMITTAGMIFIGGLGFFIYLCFEYIPPWIKGVLHF